jgi:2-polyprenyl-3-methyl-5-hydroxy-6-metoxy-1,4-benzoquinol methylase
MGIRAFYTWELIHLGGIKHRFDRCKICGGAIKMLRKETMDGLVAAKCKDCGLIFVKIIPESRMWAEDNMESTVNYYSHLYSQVPVKFRYGLDRIISYLSSMRKDDEISSLSLLDIGCGNGDFLLLCRDKGFKIAGVERSEAAAELCRKRGLNSVYVKELGDLKDTFDIITLFDVAEHLEDPKAFFAEIYHKLNPNGIVYIETPRKSILDVYINILKLKWFAPVGNLRVSRDHVQLFSDKSLRILFDTSGLVIHSFKIKQSLSWSDKKRYIINLGIKSNVIATFLEKIASVFIKLKLLGHNKAIVLARKMG